MKLSDEELREFGTTIAELHRRFRAGEFDWDTLDARCKVEEKKIMSIVHQQRNALLDEVAAEYDAHYQAIAKAFGEKRKTPRTVFHEIINQLRKKGSET